MDVWKDKRFSGVVKDPRFRKVPTKHTKTKIDKRFHGLFSGKEFELKNMVDKRGSPLDHKISEDYRKFYQLDEQDVKVKVDSSEGHAEFKRDDAKESGGKDVETSIATNAKVEADSCDEDKDECLKGTDEESDSETEDVKAENVSEGEVGSGLKNDWDEESVDEAEDTVTEEPKSSSDEDGSTTTDTETSDNEQEGEIDHRWQELDADAPLTTDVTRRLAVCNMDWDRLHAEDFFVVFNSFKPPSSVIHSIKIYPSEYGLERMEKEKLHGPAELIEEKLDSNEDNAASGTKGSRFHREKLRQYQINRLKYFFAVVDCDSPQTADALYGHLNGMEFESSGCILDLRFIPDDMTFEQEPVSAASSFSCPADYKPLFFTTSALNQVKVDLTWDETDPRRKEVLEKAFTDPESIEKDLKEYLASPSESEDEVEELEDPANIQKLSTKEAIAKYKALVQALEEKEKGKQKEEEFDMEITWEPGLKEKTEKLVKEKVMKENLTPFEEKLQKEKESKKLKKEKRMNPEKEDDISSSEESEMEDEGKEVTFKVRRKNKFKSREDPEVEKHLAELALLVAEPIEQNSSDSDDSHNRMKKKKKNKRKVKKEDLSMFQERVDDPRFAALYSDPNYHIDPSYQNLKERKKQQAFTEVPQRTRYFDSDPVVASCEISGKVDSTEGLKVKTEKLITTKDLQEKVNKFCKEFQQKTKELKQQRNGGVQKEGPSGFVADTVADASLDVDSSRKRKKGKMLKKQGFCVEGHSASVADTSSDTLLETNCSQKRKKQKKVKKQEFLRVDFGNEMFSNDSAYLNSSTKSTAYLEDDDVVSDIEIFSSGSTKKNASVFSSKAPHNVNSVRKKVKKCRTS